MNFDSLRRGLFHAAALAVLVLCADARAQLTCGNSSYNSYTRCVAITQSYGNCYIGWGTGCAEDCPCDGNGPCTGQTSYQTVALCQSALDSYPDTRAHCTCPPGETCDITTNSCQPPPVVPPCNPKLQCCPSLGGPPTEMDPVDVGTGKSVFATVDMRVKGSVSPFEFSRQYLAGTCGLGACTPFDGGAFVPSPFGAEGSNTAMYSANWWHNLYSYVYPVRNTYTNGTTRSEWYVSTDGGVNARWHVYDRNGGQLGFYACDAGTGSCLASPQPLYGTTRAQLQWNGSAFTLINPDGTRNVYANVWQAPNDGGERYFLTRVDDVQYANGGVPTTLVQLTYGDAGVSCPGISASTTNPWAPYVVSATTADGQQIDFHYSPISAPSGSPVGTECVLSSVALVDRSSGAEVPWVQYGYAQDGLLSSATWPSGAPNGRTETYSYDGGFVLAQVGTNVSVQQQDGTGAVTSASDTMEAATVSYAAASCPLSPDPTAPSCMDAGATTFSYSTAYAGDGTGAAVGLSKRKVVEFTSANNTLTLHTETTSCTSGNCNGVSQGSLTWDWSQLASGASAPSATGDKRGSWVATAYQPPAAGINPQLLELAARKEGATDFTGAGALQTTNYTYSYGPNQEQRLASTTKPSVLQAGQNAVTYNSYDAATNRLKAVIQSGYTQTFSGGSWTTAQRFVGRFYFTRTACSGGTTDDALGRVLEVHGPCLVASQNSTDCDVGTAAGIPVTQYAYYPSSASGNNANRLQRVSKYVTNADPTSCSTGTHLDTLFNSYDVLGNVTSMTDENGVTTTLTYQESNVTSSTTASLSTSYAYDNGKLTSIQHPNGNYEVFCYRTGTSGAACTGGQWTPRLQWKAKAASADGSAFSEKVAYAYWQDGTLKAETYLTPSGEVRKVVQHAADAQRRPTWETTGDSTGSYTASRFYDRADNLAGVGFAANSPPALCGGPATSNADSPASTLCAALGYDRANRLAGLDEYPGATGTRTCFQYDAQGNVSSMVSGCATTATPGDCGSCTQPSSTYRYDDFGNVVGVTAPFLGTSPDGGTFAGGVGLIDFDYDASGSLLHKQTPTMAANGEYLQYDYDLLERELDVVHYWASGTQSEVLHARTYDLTASPHAGCPTSGTLGRVQTQTDSFGVTWFQYDAFGRVTAEYRERMGTSNGCLSATHNYNSPNTFYSYDNNGNLTSIVYPYGRTVTYGYGTGALADRVSSVTISSCAAVACLPLTTCVGTCNWTGSVPVISNVLWEPYGGLRGYQAYHRAVAADAGTPYSTVEYMLGDNGSQVPSGPPTSCPAVAPNNASGSDHTGRLRGLWVSSGQQAPGVASGDIYRRDYTWQADQVKEVDTCVLDETVPRVEQFTYDNMLRLTGATAPNFSTVGGSYSSLSYGYDGRGNRTSYSENGMAFTETYDAAGRQTAHGLSAAGTGLLFNFSYDGSGRATQKTLKITDSAGRSPEAWTFTSPDGAGTEAGSGALDSVVRAISFTNAQGYTGLTYNYLYDAKSRRRSKTDPFGNHEEVFYSLNDEILSDQGMPGQESYYSPRTYAPVDDYVWLGGRPVLYVRGTLALSAPNGTVTVQQADFASPTNAQGTGCSRYGLLGVNCDTYFLTTDHIGMPVLVLDGSRLVGNVFTYDPFGKQNNVSTSFESSHPLATNTLGPQQAFNVGVPTASVAANVSLHFAIEDFFGNSCASNDHVAIGNSQDGNYSASLSDVGDVWWGWWKLTQNSFNVAVQTYCEAANNANLQCVCQNTASQYAGLVFDYYRADYQQGRTSAISHAMTPLRFPGQYFDYETGFIQNWNRFYDPAIGRYLEPEPMLQQPKYVQAMAHQGHSVPVYAYAFNNPLANTDPTGLYGTNSCEYYEERCAEAGGDYYCKEAQYWCNWFPKPPKPPSCPAGDSSQCWEGWPRCVRQCLQDCDKAKHPEPMCPAKADSDKGPWNPTSPSFDCHLTCYTACANGFDGTIGTGKAGSNGGM